MTSRLRFGLLAAPFLVVATSCSIDSGPPNENLGEAQDAMVSCPGTSTVRGIDISEFQGHPNFGSVAGSGVKFVITRTNDGGHDDPTFGANWTGIKAAGMIRGAYQYFEPSNDATQQAQYISSKVGMLGPGDLPCMIDVEQSGSPPSGSYAQAIQTWVNYVEQHTGKKPLIYTGKYFWNASVVSSSFGSYHLVDPAYFGNCYQPNGVAPDNCWQTQVQAGNCPDTANGWTKASFWQYSDSTNVPGISGHVDMDIFYGTEAQLQSLAGVMPTSTTSTGATTATTGAGATTGATTGHTTGAGVTSGSASTTAAGVTAAATGAGGGSSGAGGSGGGSGSGHSGCHCEAAGGTAPSGWAAAVSALAVAMVARRRVRRARS